MANWLKQWRRRHQHPISLTLHLVGIPLIPLAGWLAAIQLADGAWSLWWRPVGLLVTSYGLQWIGHRLEGNDMGEIILIKKLFGIPYIAVAPRRRSGQVGGGSSGMGRQPGRTGIMQTSPVVIRTAETRDAETITTFNLALALESEALRLDKDTVAAGVRAGLADETKARYFLAELDGRVIGQLMITREWSDWRNGYFWWIQSVFVARDSRSQGVCKALYEHVDSLARSRDDTCGLRLYVHNSNTSAWMVYLRLGMDLADYELFEVVW